MSHRRGLTLVEIIVVLAIVAVVVSLTIPAVLRMREASLRGQSMNNLRQIALATHNFASAHNSRLPNMDGNKFDVYPLFVSILPFLEQGGFDPIKKLHESPLTTLALYISPADPSYNFEGTFKYYPLSSYALNAQAFHHTPNLNRTFRDGLSNTIAFAEHYAVCQDTLFGYSQRAEHAGFSRRATFADGGKDLTIKGTSCGDYYPNPKTGIPNLTFQVAPPLGKCNPRLAQTPHAAGMLVGLADGSCRILAPDISAATFWAAVTPSGSEIMGPDW